MKNSPCLSYMMYILLKLNIVLDEGEIVFMKVIQLINEERMIILGYHYFITSIDVVNKHWWLLPSKKREKQTLYAS